MNAERRHPDCDGGVVDGVGHLLHLHPPLPHRSHLSDQVFTKSGLVMCAFRDSTIQGVLSSFLNGKYFRLPDKVG